MYKLRNTKKKIKKEDIEECSTSYITKDFKTRESDILYKIKNQNIFFLIEHQSKVDYSMSYRILEYSKEIIDRAIDKKKMKNKNYKMPIVYPIVIHTGRQKWNAKQTIEESQEMLPGIARREIGRYEVIDINNYTEEELIKKEGILSKIMLLEKSKTEKDLIEKINKIADGKYTKEERELLKRIIYYIFSSKLTKEEVKGVIEKLEEKKEENNMVAEEILKKSWDREYKRGKTDGKEEGILLGRKNRNRNRQRERKNANNY